MNFTVIPSIYEASREKSLLIREQFPSAFTQQPTQVSYFFRSQIEMGEQWAEERRHAEFRQLAIDNISAGVKKKNTRLTTHYKLVMPNQLGFPIVMETWNLKDLNQYIAHYLSLKNVKSMKAITDYDLNSFSYNNNTNVIIRKNDQGFPIKLYITKWKKYI